MSRSRVTTALNCRSCGAAPEQRRDELSDAATEYFCSRCLCTALPDSAGNGEGKGYADAENGIIQPRRFRHFQHDKALHPGVPLRPSQQAGSAEGIRGPEAPENPRASAGVPGAAAERNNHSACCRHVKLTASRRHAMIDEHAKELLNTFARRLIFGISQEDHRLRYELAPHALEEWRWREFLEHVVTQSPEPARSEAAREAEQIRTLLVQYRLTPEGATHWAAEFLNYREGWGGQIR
jgi:hypothetical protein